MTQHSSSHVDLAAADVQQSADRPGFWQQLTRLWCKHPRTHVIARNGLIPAHVVCDTCGWREPAPALEPIATRTWDSSRDEGRYEQEKKRRIAADQQRLVANSVRALPTPKAPKVRRASRSNIVEMKRNSA